MSKRREVALFERECELDMEGIVATGTRLMSPSASRKQVVQDSQSVLFANGRP